MDFQIPSKALIGTVDGAADSMLIYDASAAALKRTTRNVLLNLTSGPLGLTDTQSPTNKTFDNTNTFTIRDDRLTLQDNADTTKQLVFQLSGITTGTTRTLTIPNVSDTLVTLAATQTLTNKTLTAPTISSATITNPTLTVDTISEFTSANGVVVDGLLIKDGAIPQSGLPVGSVVQVATTTSSAVATGTTTIPSDDTIPQNTEGTEFMTLAITPKSATNILVIDVCIMLSSATSDRWLIAALFQDAAANALAVGEAYEDIGTALDTVCFRHIMVAGTTSSTTFKVRAGCNSAATMTFNGASGGRFFGATIKSSIVITEYKA